MGNRTAKFISALVGSIIAGAPLAAMSQNATTAVSTASGSASDCLASPKGTAPQGEHWFYRLDRATKRQCWYLRAEGGKTTQTAQATTEAPNAEPAPSPSVQNARAEYVAPKTGAAPSIAVPAPATSSAPPVMQQPPGATADNNAQQPAVAPWPDTSTTSAAPAAQPAPATAAPQPAKPPAPVALAAAEIPVDKPTGSLPTLLLVIGGALALAGVLASVIYRFAGARVRVRASDHRRMNWDDWEPQNHDETRAPWLHASPADMLPRRPVDFDAERPQAPRPQAAQLAAFSDEIGRIAAQTRFPHNEVAAELDEADLFNGEFEIEAAPQLMANEAEIAGDEKNEEATPREEDTPREEHKAREEHKPREEDTIDIDIITAMLERLAKEGPRLAESTISQADSAGSARSLQDRPGVRA